MSPARHILPQVVMRWGSVGGGVCRCVMHLHDWGYLWWNYCGWVNAPKCGGRDHVGGGDISPMYDSRGNVSGRSTTPLCGKSDSVCGGVIARFAW